VCQFHNKLAIEVGVAHYVVLYLAVTIAHLFPVVFTPLLPIWRSEHNLCCIAVPFLISYANINDIKYSAYTYNDCVQHTYSN